MDTRYDERTALVVVDVQNDFADPDGGLTVDGGLEAIEHVNAEIASAREAGALIVCTQDWHPPSTPHFDTDGGTWPVHCVRDTWGAELHPDLDVDAAVPVVRKGTGGEDGYSGFSVRDPETGQESATDLEHLLRERGIERVVVVGLALDVCVKATALDSERLGFSTEVVRAATAPVELEPGDGDRAVEDLTLAGVHVH